MSTKIYNGYYSEKNITELLIMFGDIKKNFEKLKELSYLKYVAHKSIFKYDHESIVLNQPISLKDIKKDVHDKALGKIKDVVRQGMREPDVDFEVTCAVYPMRGKTLILFYAENKEMTNFWENLEDIHDYHYQNSCDKPDDISNVEWNRRRKNWDKVFNPTPSKTCYTYTFSSVDLPYYIDNDKLNKVIPSKSERAARIVSSKFIAAHIENQKQQNPSVEAFASYYAATDDFIEYKKTDDYLKEISTQELLMEDLLFS